MFGLRFKESGNFVPLGKDIVFPMRFKNPLLVEDDNFQAMWSLPVSLPYSEALWRELKIPDNPNVVKPNSAQHEVDLLVAKALHYDGTLQLLRADKNRAEVNVWDKLFPDGFGEQTIKEVMDGVSYDIIDFTPYCTIEFEGTATTSTWTFSYGIYDFVIISGATIDDTIDDLVTQINATEPDHGLHATNMGSNFMQLEDGAMWGRGLSIETNITTSGDTITVAGVEWSQWVKDYHQAFRLQMETVCDEDEVGTYNYTFFPMYNPDFYGEENADWTGWINAYDTGTEKFLVNIDAATPWTGHKYTVVPFIYFKTVFDKIFADAGITVSGNFVERQGFKQFVIYNTQSLDIWYANDELVVFNKTITVKKHLPDMTVRDFLLEFRKLYNLKYDYNKAKAELKITERQNALNRVVKTDWRRKLQATNPEYTFQNADGITFSSAHDTGDEFSEFFGLQHDDYVYGNGLNTITSEWSWPSIEQIEDVIGPIYPGDEFGLNYVPVAKQQGNSEVYALQNTFTPRLLFYRGWAPNTIAVDYPYANTTTYDSLHALEDQETGENTYDLTLVWSKLFVEFYADWVTFFDSTITCEVSLILPVTEIQLYNLDHFYMFEESDWLVDEIEVGNVYADDILCRVKLVREAA